MDPRDFLTLAQQLASASTEAAWRSAASRAYYAAFHVAGKLMRDLGFTVPHADRAHGHVWLRLSNSGNSRIEHAATSLNNSRRDRNRADYDLHLSVQQTAIQRQIPAAAGIIRDFEAAALEPTRKAITNAMKIYERDVLHDVTWHP